MSGDPSRPPAAQPLSQPVPAPTVEPGRGPQPPSLEDELAVLAFLECSRELSADTTGYLTEALLQWALFEPTVSPDPTPPPEHGLSHLAVLERIAASWSRRSQSAASVTGKLALGRIGRQLVLAGQCQREPDLLSEALWREDLQRMPWLAAPLPPARYRDGSAL